jgi:hypothetical protein
MNLASLLLDTGVAFPIMVSYLVAMRYLERRHGVAGRYGVIGRDSHAQRITGRLRWIKADELKLLIDADPDLVVFHLLDDDPSAARAKRLETEIGVTLPQLEEALPWMSRGTRFAVYRVDGIAPELAQRLSAMTQGRQVLLLAGKLSPACERSDGHLTARY